MKHFRTTVAAAGLLLGGAVSASAGLLDFTVNGSILVGTYKGIGYTVTGMPVAPNQNQAFDGDAAEVLVPLALENDGLGIRDDEITGPFAESLTITFDEEVTLVGFYALDLFEAPGNLEDEVAILNGMTYAPTNALEVFGSSPPNTGFAAFSTGPIKGTVFTFQSGGTNDNQGEPDYSLAALEIAPIPLPAGVLLLGTALAGLGFARRRKA